MLALQVGELNGEVAQAQAVADVPALRAALAELEAQAAAGNLWDDPSKVGLRLCQLYSWHFELDVFRRHRASDRSKCT